MNSPNVKYSQPNQPDYPLIIYQPEGSTSAIQLAADPEQRTIWATQRQIAEALNITVQGVSQQIHNFKEQRGQNANRDINQWFISAADGKSYLVEHYNLTVITFVGFRAKATERVIAFQDWVGKELDRILAEKKVALTPAELILAQAKQLVEHERDIHELENRQVNTEERLSRVEARQTAMVDAGSQHMSISAYCLWKNIDVELCNPRHLPALTDKARQLSKDRRYPIGKAQNQRSGYDDTFHLDILTEIFVGFRS